MIRGLFDSRFGGPLPCVWVGLILPHRGETYTPIEFVVDTGAAVSAIHPYDARENLRLSPDDFSVVRRVARERHSLAGITGSEDYYVVPARYIFAHENGTPQVVEGEVRIAEPVPSNVAIPSVLGWDFLARFRVILDRQRGEVLLE